MKTRDYYAKGISIIQSIPTRNLTAIIILSCAITINNLLARDISALPVLVSDGIPIEKLYPVNKAIKEAGKYLTKDGIIKTDLELPSTTIESSDLLKVLSVYNADDYIYSNYSYTLPEDLTEEQKELYNRIANINTDEMYLAIHSETGEEDLVDCALDEIGVIFDYNSNSTPYGEWYYENINSNYDFRGAPWCAMFVSYNLNKLDSSLPMFAAVDSGAALYQEEAKKGNGEWHWSGDYIPKRNDIFFDYLGKNSHTGIVMASDGVYQYTIDGNTCDDEWNYAEGCVNTTKCTLSYINGGYYTPNIKVNEDGLSRSEAFVEEKNQTISY